MKTLDGDTTTFPLASEYRSALLALRDQLSANQLLLLQHHYHAPGQSMTARQLAEAVAYKDYRAVNLQYGKLAGKLCEALNVMVKEDKVYVLASFAREPEISAGECQLIMRPELAQALVELGWV